MRTVLLLLLAVLLSGSACDPVRPDPGNPLAVANCPESLPLIADDTFGGTVTKAIEWAGIYHKCRAAAVGTGKGNAK